MGYKKEHYNAVLQAIVRVYNLNEERIPDWQWTAWRSAIKRLFDQGILIKEIVSALEEAAWKRKWPINTSLFRRIEDVVLKNRNEAWVERRDTGPTALKDIFNAKNLTH